MTPQQRYSGVPRPPRVRLAVTADLHWGHRRGNEATRQLVRFLSKDPPDVLILAGDIGAANHFGECLALFADLPGTKALVPGNHDLWVNRAIGHDSLERYRVHLPHLAQAHGFHYLDHGPLIIPEADVALVGTINWYDYSWALPRLQSCYPAELERLESKRFIRGRHNDANFIRWSLDDITFTTLVVEQLERHLTEALAQVSQAIVITHHPAFYDVSFPRCGPPLFLDQLLWDAFAGNARLEEVLRRHADRIALVFSGHTHRARTNNLGSITGYNVGSDYSLKRLLLIDWPSEQVAIHEFGKSPLTLNS